MSEFADRFDFDALNTFVLYCTFGGHNVDRVHLSEFADRFDFDALITFVLYCTFGGHKWTRTTDLTLIRREL